MKRLTILLVSVALSACGDATGTAGRYILQAANGVDLPYPSVLAGSNETVTVTAGSMQMNSDSTFSAVFDLQITESGTTTTSTSSGGGTWSQTGNQLRLSLPDGSVQTGVVAEDQISLRSGGMSLVYRK